MVVAEERRSSRRFCKHRPQKQASKSIFYLLRLVRFALSGSQHIHLVLWASYFTLLIPKLAQAPALCFVLLQRTWIVDFVVENSDPLTSNKKNCGSCCHFCKTNCTENTFVHVSSLKNKLPYANLLDLEARVSSTPSGEKDIPTSDKLLVEEVRRLRAENIIAKEEPTSSNISGSSSSKGAA